MSPFRSEHVNAADLPELEAPSTEGALSTRCKTLRWHKVLDLGPHERSFEHP